METDGERRFTEREVALILRKAVELERIGVAPEDVGGGLTLDELREIAGRVGIHPDAIGAAAAELDVHGGGREARWLGPPSARRASRILPVGLSAGDQKLLFRTVERRLGVVGMLSEAFGQARWSSTRAQLTTEVILTRDEREFRIDVEQRYPSRVRPLLHAFGGAFGAAVAASFAVPAVVGAALLGVAVGGGILGAAIGRGLWYVTALDSDPVTDAVPP